LPKLLIAKQQQNVEQRKTTLKKLIRVDRIIKCIQIEILNIARLPLQKLETRMARQGIENIETNVMSAGIE
jgi:hypothetical protein